MEKKNRTRLDSASKELIIKSVAEEGAQVSDIAGQYDAGPSTVHRWVKEYRESLTGLVSESEAEKITAAYEKKIRALEEENEILRKAIRGFSDIER
ncbi:MAG: transposase [Solibacillus sp.]|uniref:transposase n=1 Tax=Solibacillus sp. TaxID=1909654 RepID=UPI0033154B45